MLCIILGAHSTTAQTDEPGVAEKPSNTSNTKSNHHAQYVTLARPIADLKHNGRAVHMLYVSTGNRLGKTIRAIYEEAFKRIGVKLTIETCAALACSLKMKRGEADGELVRATIYHSQVSKLIQVTEAVYVIHWAAYSKRKDLELYSFDQLQYSRWRIVTVSGLVDVDRELAKTNATHIIRVSHWQKGLTKLNNDEADIFIGEKRSVAELLKKPVNKAIIYNGTLKQVPLYAFFTAEHRQLAQVLAATLKQMKIDGTIARIEAGITQ